MTQPPPRRPGKGAQSPLLRRQRMGGAPRAMSEPKGAALGSKPLPTQACEVETRQEGRGGCKGQGRRVCLPSPHTVHAPENVKAVQREHRHQAKDHLSLQALSGEQHPYRDVTGSQTDPTSRSKQGATQQNQEALAVWVHSDWEPLEPATKPLGQGPFPSPPGSQLLLPELQLLHWATQDP